MEELTFIKSIMINVGKKHFLGVAEWYTRIHAMSDVSRQYYSTIKVLQTLFCEQCDMARQKDVCRGRKVYKKYDTLPKSAWYNIT